jgi:hypothetical protein
MILAVIIIVSGVSPAFSEVSFKDYETVKNTKEFKLYIGGIGEGIGWSNVVLDLRKSKKIFCQPSNLTMSVENLLDILKREIDENGKTFKSDMPLGLILIRGLVKNYPCK